MTDPARDDAFSRFREEVAGALDRQERLIHELADGSDGLHELAGELSLLRAHVALLSKATASQVESVRDGNIVPAGGAGFAEFAETAAALLGTGDLAAVVAANGTLPARPEWLVDFPSVDDGAHAGHDVPDGTAAVAQLESLRGQRVRLLLVPPGSSSSWFDQHPRFAGYVSDRFRAIHSDGSGGTIFDLAHGHATVPASSTSTIETLLSTSRSRLDGEPTVLDWGTGLDFEHASNDLIAFSLPANAPELPYADDSVGVVVLPTGDEARLREARRVASAAVVVASGGDSSSLRIDWLRKRTERDTTVSIVIPVYDGVALTERCLTALQETLPTWFRGEVIVVDDASTDDTSTSLGSWARGDPRIQVVRNPSNAGFLASCNRGADESSGDLILFLNNDTIPLAGWLEAILDTFRSRPNAGAVGGKLVYPDGRLQEAGGVIFSDGSGANVGRGDREVDYPLYNYLRQVDYCSAALLATRRDLFKDLGGFDSRYRPAYYEDTDYCFGVRKAGLEVYYQPRSAVVHVEGASSGSDPARGVKRHQEINRKKFVAKWARSIRRQPEPPTTYDRATWHRLAVREAS